MSLAVEDSNWPLQLVLRPWGFWFVWFFNQILIPMNKRKGSRRNSFNLKNSLGNDILLFLGLCIQCSAWRKREYLSYPQGVGILVSSWLLVLVQLSSVQTVTSGQQSSYSSSDIEAGDERDICFQFHDCGVGIQELPKMKKFLLYCFDPWYPQSTGNWRKVWKLLSPY